MSNTVGGTKYAVADAQVQYGVRYFIFVAQSSPDEQGANRGMFRHLNSSIRLHSPNPSHSLTQIESQTDACNDRSIRREERTRKLTLSASEKHVRCEGCGMSKAIKLRPMRHRSKTTPTDQQQSQRLNGNQAMYRTVRNSTVHSDS